MRRVLFLSGMLFLLSPVSHAQDSTGKSDNPTGAQADSKTAQETARGFTRNGDYTNAIVVLNRAIKQDPENIELQKDLCFNYYLEHDYPKGIETARPLTERPDADVQCYQLLGLFYKGINDGPACEKLYKGGLKRWPKSGVLYNEYGEVLYAKQEDKEAIKNWEKGIEVDPNYSSNYYNASKFYYNTTDKIWCLIYGEIFVNLESYSKRTAEIKEVLLDGYKKLFSDPDLTKNQNLKSAFATAWFNVIGKAASAISQGITTESLTVLRTEFIINWFEDYPTNFPFRLFDYQRQLLKDGLFDAYNQWIFGAAGNLSAFQTWTNTHTDDYNRLTNYQKGRIFKLPEGQYYQALGK